MAGTYANVPKIKAWKFVKGNQNEFTSPTGCGWWCGCGRCPAVKVAQSRNRKSNRSAENHIESEQHSTLLRVLVPCYGLRLPPWLSLCLSPWFCRRCPAHSRLTLPKGLHKNTLSHTHILAKMITTCGFCAHHKTSQIGLTSVKSFRLVRENIIGMCFADTIDSCRRHAPICQGANICIHCEKPER